MDEGQRNWDELLPLVMLTYRSSVHESTGESPAKMLFGREVTLPIYLLLGASERVEEYQCCLSYVTDLRNTLCEIHNMAREKMLLASDRQKKAYDFRQNFRSYKIGETVYLHNPARKVDSSEKLHCPWTGPFLVVERISDLVYKIQESPGDAKKCVHHDRLKPSVIKLKTGLRTKV